MGKDIYIAKKTEIESKEEIKIKKKLFKKNLEKEKNIFETRVLNRRNMRIEIIRNILK